METRALNEEFLRPNYCCGCGPDSPDGLRIRIYRDAERMDRLVGTFEPLASRVGFPGIVHGGAQFTALDCMAAWILFALRKREVAIPLTKSASMRFHRPAKVGDSFKLSSEVIREPESPKDATLIHTELRDSTGELVSEADYEYVVVPEAKFLNIVGLSELPDAYQRHFGVRPQP